MLIFNLIRKNPDTNLKYIIFGDIQINNYLVNTNKMISLPGIFLVWFDFNPNRLNVKL